MQNYSFINSQQIFKIVETYKDSVHGNQFKFYTHMIGREVTSKACGLDDDRWFIHEFGVIQGSSANYTLKIVNFDSTRVAITYPEYLEYYIDEDKSVSYLEYIDTVKKEMELGYVNV